MYESVLESNWYSKPLSREEEQTLRSRQNIGLDPRYGTSHERKDVLYSKMGTIAGLVSLPLLFVAVGIVGMSISVIRGWYE